MKKVLVLVFAVIALGGCDKKDPVLPGTRIPVFYDGGALQQSSETVSNIIGKVPVEATPVVDSKYIMSDNNIMTRKSDGKVIFSGFPTATKAGPAAVPIASGEFVFAGLSTGEVLKINANTGAIVWTVDLGSRSLLTGGSIVSDISVMALHGKFLYVSGLGGVTAKIDVANGGVKWAVNVGTNREMLLSGRALALIELGGALMVLDANDGALVARYDLSRDDFDKIELIEDGWRVSNKRREQVIGIY